MVDWREIILIISCLEQRLGRVPRVARKIKRDKKCESRLYPYAPMFLLSVMSFSILRGEIEEGALVGVSSTDLPLEI